MKNLMMASATLALCAGMAQAGGLDRSGQSVLAVFNESGTAGVSFGIVDPSVTGNDLDPSSSGDYNAAKRYTQAAADYTRAINEQLSFTMIYDQPFGADIFYNGDPTTAALAGTEAALSSDALSFLGKYQVNENISIFGGLRAQRVGGKIALNGTAYHSALATAGVAAGSGIDGLSTEILGGALLGDPTASAGLAALLGTTVGSALYTGTLTALGGEVVTATAGIAATGGYSVVLEDDYAAGYTIGAAYEIPDIALRAAITYHSEIDHDNATTEMIAGETVVDKVEFFSPQSVNIEFQTGIAADTLLNAGVRWTNWGDFDVIPTRLGADLANLDDSYRYTVGIARRFSPEFAGSVNIAYEESSGDDNVSPLGPNDGQLGITVGMRYQDNNGFTMSGGINYTWLGDADAGVGGADVATFDDNTVFGFGVRGTWTF